MSFPARERIYEGVINGVRFRYSVMIGPRNDRVGIEARELDHADRQFMSAFFKVLTEQATIVIRTEDFTW